MVSYRIRIDITLEDFKEKSEGMRMLVMDPDEIYKCIQCSCIDFGKKRYCKHSLGWNAAFGHHILHENVLAQPLQVNRRRGRPRINRGAVVIPDLPIRVIPRLREWQANPEN